MKQYDVLVVDPPWEVKKIHRDCRPNQVEMGYPMMSIDEITRLPLPEICKENSVCFLWTIQKYIERSFSILREWGFKYLLTLTWDKGNGLCLFGFHWRTEFVLVGYKGNLPMYPSQPTMPSLLNSSSGRNHSTKPQVFYDYAETFGQDRIDIFARRQRMGWDVYGNEVYSSVKLDVPPIMYDDPYKVHEQIR